MALNCEDCGAKLDGENCPNPNCRPVPNEPQELPVECTCGEELETIKEVQIHDIRNNVSDGHRLPDVKIPEEVRS